MTVGPYDEEMREADRLVLGGCRDRPEEDCCRWHQASPALVEHWRVGRDGDGRAECRAAVDGVRGRSAVRRAP